VLVITCIDAMSYFAETLRRLLANLLIDPGEPLEVRTPLCVRAFGPHLATLSGMTRSPEDWVVDNLINPASIGRFLSIPDAITALGETYDVFGTSPRFLTDWRWYKDIGMDGRFNALAIDEYWANAHRLLDYRYRGSPGDPARNRLLYDACLAVQGEIRTLERARDRAGIDRIQSWLRRIRDLVQNALFDVDRALQDVDRLISAATIDADRIASADHLRPWFGRGQQYVSFSRSRA